MIIETQRTNFKAMKDIEWLNESIDYHMKVLRQSTDKVKIMELLQRMSEFSVKTLGVSFMSNKTMAKIIGVSVRTVQRYTATMESLGIILKVATSRDKNNGQTSNTYVIKPIIKACHGGCHPFKPSTKPNLKQDNNISLYSNFDTNNDIYSNEEDYKILQLFKLKLADRNIENPSSYVEKMLKNYEEYEHKVKVTQRRREERKQRFEQAKSKYGNIVYGYNWLES